MVEYSWIIVNINMDQLILYWRNLQKKIIIIIIDTNNFYAPIIDCKAIPIILKIYWNIL